MRIKIRDKNNFINMFNKTFENNKINNINSISIDSRKIEKDDIFIPIKGDNFDGHNFIEDSLKKGAVLSFSENETTNEKIINIESSQQIIEKLASLWAEKTKSKIIGITGSNGKTTTKEILFSILSNKYKCSKSKGNYNSKIGLPLAFLNSKINDDYCILEYGASKPNEIAYLCNIIKPHISLITNISDAHIENFSSINELAKTKLAIFSILDNEDYAFINNDDKYISKINLKCNKISFGYNLKSDFNGSLFLKNNLKNININNKNNLKVPETLAHLKENILSAYSISIFAGIEHNDIQKSISSFLLPSGRGRKFLLDGYNIIDDSYNANPESVKLAIKRLSEIKTSNKKILIFADMLELGKDSNNKHKQIGTLLDSSNIDLILTYGKLSEVTSENILKVPNKHFYNILKLKNYLKRIISKNDIIYLKGSNSMKLEKIYKEGLK